MMTKAQKFVDLSLVFYLLDKLKLKPKTKTKN